MDVASAVGSLVILIANPSLENLGNFAWDVGSALIPFVPGSYVAKAGKIAVKVAGKLDDFAGGTKLLAGPYKLLKKYAKGLSGVEIHHLIEKRFKSLFSCNGREFLSIALTPEMHQEITNRWRNLHKVNDIFQDFAYRSNYRKITYDLMVKAVETVYTDMPDVLHATLKWLEKNWKVK